VTWGVRVSVIGDKEIKQMFADAFSVMRTNLREALALIGSIVRDRAAARAPRETGALAASIRARLLETAERIIESVAPTRFYARFLEFGVVAHGTTRNHSALGSKIKRVEHIRTLRSSGQYRIQPHPFMGPASAAVRSQIDAMLQAAVNKVPDEVK
jgi:HK97 gp10 family phage protein